MAVHPPRVSVVGLDGDDTLWHNESIFAATHERFRAMVGRYVPADDLDALLLATEQRNITLFGYGIKGYALSLIETAIEVTDGRIEARDTAQIVQWAKDMLRHPVDLLDGVVGTLEQLAADHHLALVTKGDFFHQESKLARSGLVELFDTVNIVAEKDPEVYRRTLRRIGADPASFVMVGNSVRSDVLPVLAIGGHAVHIPYHVTWEHERVADHDRADGGWTELGDIRELPALLDRWRRAGAAHGPPTRWTR